MRRKRICSDVAEAYSQAENERLMNYIKEALEVIPGSMGGHVTIGLNILLAALRPEQRKDGENG